MNDEFEYDYHGVLITTHTKEECTDVMQYDVLIGDHYYDDTAVLDRVKGGSPHHHKWLSEKDRELLIEYAPKLFDTLPKEKDLYDSMLGLATILGKYRFEVLWHRKESARMDSYSHSKKRQEDKEEALKKHIDAIVKIIGTDMYIPKGEEISHLRTSRDDLLDELERAYQNPMSYLPPGNIGYSLEENEHGEIVKVSHHTKQPMEEYLKALDLKNRSDIIKEFVKKITDQNWFSTFLVKQQRPPIV